MNYLSMLTNELFIKTRVSLAQFELLEKEERMRHLIGEFEQTSGLAKKHGVYRVELLFRPFGVFLIETDPQDHKGLEL